MAASSVTTSEAPPGARRGHTLKVLGRERMRPVGAPARSLRAIPTRLAEARADLASTSTRVARRHRRPSLPKSGLATRAWRSIALINGLLLLLGRNRFNVLPARLHEICSCLDLRRMLHPAEIGTSDHLAFLIPVQEERRAFAFSLQNNKSISGLLFRYWVSFGPCWLQHLSNLNLPHIPSNFLIGNS